MKYILCVGVVLLVSYAMTHHSTDKVRETAKKSTVYVETDVGSVGAGVVVNDHCVATAAHVVAQGKLKVTTSEGKEYNVTRTVYDEEKDVAAICASSPIDAPPVTFSSLPFAWTPVFTIGSPLGNPYVLTEGRYQGGDLTSLPCAPGNSGGGVFTNKGDYIGFVDYISIDEGLLYPNLCHIIPSGTLAIFLLDHNIKFLGVV